MKLAIVISAFTLLLCCLSFRRQHDPQYANLYHRTLASFDASLKELSATIHSADLSRQQERDRVRELIHQDRLQLKSLDFWFRYLEPVAYRRINGPLPVEWENEVFEKFEPPYRREGAGLTLAEQYLDEENISTDSLDKLIRSSIDALNTFRADSITANLSSFHHFFLANRLFLLNLAAIYTTGFDCPDTNRVVPELGAMLQGVDDIYSSYEASFPANPVSPEYLKLYAQLRKFVTAQPVSFSTFDHYHFIRDYVNPLFRLNQEAIVRYNVRTNNYNDYTLNNYCNSIFDKSLYTPQNAKGIYSLVEDSAVIADIKRIGKLLFYDPILSSNNARSCASCHKPGEFFTDTATATAFTFNHEGRLARNTPSLVNVIYNHLIMLDGKHISLQDQVKAVIVNKEEMGDDADAIVRKVLDCREYRDAFKRFLKYTPEENKISIAHIAGAITSYYAGFSSYSAPFDRAMNHEEEAPADVRNGFNLFMSKAQCGTCHFVPIFNGVKPPYISSEFEVIGVPDDTAFHKLSDDKGRFLVNPAPETEHAFRTSTLRNTASTKPYMHNGVFQTLEQVIDMYDAGGGSGRKLSVPNQTLSADSLKLSPREKKDLLAFIHSLNENVSFDAPPASLPSSGNKQLNNRKIGGDY